MSMKKMQILLSLLLVSLMLLSFTACGGNSGSSQQSTSAAISTESSQPTTVSTEKPKENINLIVWFPSAGGDNSSPARTKLNAAFETENPYIKISEVAQPNDNYDQLIKAANLAGNGPDILELWPGAPTIAYSKFLTPLNKYLGDSYINNYFGWNLARVDFGATGDVYGVPQDTYMYGIWYNKEMLAKVGVTDSNAPKTWEELLNISEKLKQKDITPFCIGTKDGYMLQWGAGALLCTLMGNDGGKVADPSYKFAGSEVQKATELWQEIGKRGYVIKDTASVSTGDDQDRKFVSGAGAMLLSGNWELKPLREGMKDNLGFFKFPAADPNNSNKDFNYAGPGINLCVTSYSKHVEDAVKYIKALTSDQFMIDRCNETGNLPTSLSVDASKITDPTIQMMYGMLKSGNNAVILDLINLNAFNEYVRMGSLVTTGKMSAQEVCSLMDKEIEKSQAK